jgi:hypothetical protein
MLRRRVLTYLCGCLKYLTSVLISCHQSTQSLPEPSPPRIGFPSFPYRMENKSIYRGEEQTARYSNFVEGSIKSSARISYAAYSGPSFILQLRGCQIT